MPESGAWVCALESASGEKGPVQCVIRQMTKLLPDIEPGE